MFNVHLFFGSFFFVYLFQAICCKPFCIMLNTKHTYFHLIVKNSHRNSSDSINTATYSYAVCKFYYCRERKRSFFSYGKKHWPEALANRPAATYIRTYFSSLMSFLFFLSFFLIHINSSFPLESFTQPCFHFTFCKPYVLKSNSM